VVAISLLKRFCSTVCSARDGLPRFPAAAFLLILLPWFSFAHLASGAIPPERFQQANATAENSHATTTNWSFQVRTLITQKKLAQAERMIVRRMMSQPRDPTLITLLAEVRLDQARWQEALNLLSAANTLGGESAFRLLLAGLAQSGRRRLDLAEPDFRKAIKIDAHYAAAHYFLARLLYTQNHFDESIRESKQAIFLSPNFVRAYENLGLCYEAKQQAQEAKHWYLEAIQLENEGGRRTEWPMLDLATMLIKNNQTSEAKKYLAEALAINPNNSDAVFEMGVLLEKSGDLQHALQEFRKAARLAPHQANAYYRMARIYGELGDTSDERKDFAIFRQITEANHSPRAPNPAAGDAKVGP
jgi:tetratricopeptide (TPR) repeat protein